ncbi:hypothetical protein D3C78_1572070 [compost metagenome]
MLKTFLYLEAGFRRFAFAIDAHDTFAALQNVFQQRCLHGFTMRLPLAAHQRQIILLHAFQPQLLMQRTQCRTFFSHQQHAGSIAIQPVHQFQETGFRAQRAQALNHAKAQAAATVHRGA